MSVLDILISSPLLATYSLLSWRRRNLSYLVPFARGNTATCDAQGFLTWFAAFVSVCYNCCICFHYLAIITYNKKHDYIRKKLEPWFHGISILFPLVISAILVATNTFNGPDGGNCYPEQYHPPHCIGHEAGDIPKGYSIPCGRGGPYDGLEELRVITLNGAWLWVLIIAPIIILVTMESMFRSVTKIEKRMQKYGVSALRFRTSLAEPHAITISADQQEARGFAGKMKKLGKYLSFLCPCAGDAGRYDPKRLTKSTKSNKMTSQKRAVLYMAFGYAGAWVLVFTSLFLMFISLKVAKSEPDTVVMILAACMTPLQGFFNFVVFMAPKVRSTRTMAMQRGRNNCNKKQNQQHLKKEEYMTWRQAFYKPYIMSRRGLEDRNMRNNNRPKRRSIIFGKINGTFRTTFERMKSFTTSSRIPIPEIIDID